MSYEDAIANLQEKGIKIEKPGDRKFYDDIGKIDYLSAVPFMTSEEHNSLTTARQLNSISLAVAVFYEDTFKILFYNSAFEKISHNAGIFTNVFTQEMLCQPLPYHALSRKILNLMDSAKVEGDGKMLFTINEQYYEIKVRRMAQTKEKYCVLVSIKNLSKDTQAEKTSIGDRVDHEYESSKRETLTGLLNSRGISEEADFFHDEYYLSGTDFVRIHIGINDFNTINNQYGFDFGDKVLIAFGNALKQEFGQRSAIGRYAGRKFTILLQIENKEEAHKLRERIKEIGRSIHEVDGTPITLYLSVGYALYSEHLNLAEQTKKAEIHLHADYDKNISAENRIEHALELFSLFDDLPVGYCVFRVTHSETSDSYDVVFFYINHKYEEVIGFPAKYLVGYTVRERFPFLGDDWYNNVKSAALDGKIIEGDFVNPFTNKRFRFVARQIIYPGYCCITCMDV